MARGSVRKHDGGWGYRIDLGPDPATGKRRQASRQGFATKREAETALRDVTSSMPDGVVPTRSVRTLGDFLDEWLELQRDRLRPTTWHSYGHAVRASSRASVDRSCKRLLYCNSNTSTPSCWRRVAAPASRCLRRRCGTHTVLRKALADAERLGLVGCNPAAAAKPPADVRVRAVRASTTVDMGALQRHIGDGAGRPAMSVLWDVGPAQVCRLGAGPKPPAPVIPEHSSWGDTSSGRRKGSRGLRASWYGAELSEPLERSPTVQRLLNRE